MRINAVSKYTFNTECKKLRLNILQILQIATDFFPIRITNKNTIKTTNKNGLFKSNCISLHIRILNTSEHIKKLKY